MLINDRLNIGRKTGLVWLRRRDGIHLHTVRGCRHGVTGTSFLVLSAVNINLAGLILREWGGRRGLNPRHSVPQTDALPAELRPPVADSKQFTLLFPTAKAGSMGPTHQFYCQSTKELMPTHATCKADADACTDEPFSLTRDQSML